MRLYLFLSMALHVLVPCAAAQTNISNANKFAWSENAGWFNFRDAGSPVGAMGARFHLAGGFASGYVWGENIGWINLGSGAGPYANTSDTNFGVNFNTTTGHMSGYAWSENTGWINFLGGSLATPSNPARVDFVAKRLRGFAWSENLGWINLDSTVHFVGIRCTADVNDDGIVSPADFTAWIAAFNAQTPECDQNADTLCTPADFTAWIANYNAGC